MTNNNTLKEEFCKDFSVLDNDPELRGISTDIADWWLDKIQQAKEERDEEWRNSIQGLINTSNENASQNWYNGLRACKSIIINNINNK